MPSSIAEPPNLIELTADIVSSFVSNNSVPVGEVPNVIQSVHMALVALCNGAATPEPVAPAREAAVSVRKSITPDYLVCLDDGKQFKSLKRHLRALGMTADQYRAKWNLPSDYPMVAPNYAAQRSALAIRIGLGQSRKGVPRKPKQPAKAAKA